MKTRLLHLSALCFVVLLALTACGENDPITIYVTPTPGESTSAVPVAEAASPVTAKSLPESPAPSATLPPGVNFGPITDSSQALPPTPSTPPPTAPGSSASPTIASDISFGPIVGPNHTLEPTETRLPPTLAPSPVPTAGPSPTPIPGLDRNLMGVQIHPHISSREFEIVLARVKDLGLGWVKFQFNWSLLESAPGQYTDLFYMLRDYVRQMHDAGLKVMASVAKAPGWSRTPDPDGTLRENGPSNDPQSLANFITAMLNQIGTDAQGRSYIDAVQVWNEPNLQREWYGYPLTGESYMRYFGPAYDAVRRFSPDIIVITAAPAPTGDSDWSANDRAWLQQLYDNGLGQYTHNVGVGAHPYGWANSPAARCCANPSRGWDDKPQFFFLNTLEDYHAILLANGQPNTRLWVTEFGWATFDGLQTNGGSRPSDPSDTPYFSFIDQWQQASYTLQAFSLAQDRSYVGPMMLWNLNFSTVDGAVDHSDPKAGYAILDTHWQPRPVYYALKDAPKS